MSDIDTHYAAAVGLIVLSGKCSTAFVQRNLGIKYNDAARHVEVMQAAGIVSRPNHLGRREVMVCIRPEGGAS